MEQFPLGLIPGGKYESQRIPYCPGDLFLLFTDGVSEVENDSDEQFGLNRLEQLMMQHVRSHYRVSGTQSNKRYGSMEYKLMINNLAHPRSALMERTVPSPRQSARSLCPL